MPWHAACQNKTKRTRRGWRTDADTEVVHPSWQTARAPPTLQIDLRKKAKLWLGRTVRDELQKFGDQGRPLVMWPSPCPRDGLNFARYWSLLSSLSPPWHYGGMGLVLQDDEIIIFGCNHCLECSIFFHVYMCLCFITDWKTTSLCRNLTVFDRYACN